MAIAQRKAAALRIATELKEALDAFGYRTRLRAPDHLSTYTRLQIVGGRGPVRHMLRYARSRDTRIELSPIETDIIGSTGVMEDGRIALSISGFVETLQGRTSTLGHELEHADAWANRRNPNAPPHVQHHNEPLVGENHYAAYFTADEDRAFIRRSLGADLRLQRRKLMEIRRRGVRPGDRSLTRTLHRDARHSIRQGRRLTRASLVRSVRLHRALERGELIPRAHPERGRNSREAFLVQRNGETVGRLKYALDRATGDWTAEVVAETEDGWDGPKIEIVLRARRNASLESRNAQVRAYLAERATRARDHLGELRRLEVEFRRLERTAEWQSLRPR